MSTQADLEALPKTQPLVKVVEMDHIVLRCKDVDASMRFYNEVLGMEILRLDEFRAGNIRFPSARLNADTIIDFFPAPDQPPIGKDGIKNQDHFCMVIEPQDMEALKERCLSLGIEVQQGPGTRWGAHGNGTSLYIYDPDDNVVELRHYS
jgi:catechol 2,3-dioxygenase-like lactoylglutathione lyase family enzyme